MYIPKKYGQSRKDACPFCGRTSVTQNIQGIPTCIEHKKLELMDIKCACGDYLDIMTGKYGVYFNCLKCGNINFKKGLEINSELISEIANKAKKDKIEKRSNQVKKRFSRSETKETVVTSDDVDIFYS